MPALKEAFEHAGYVAPSERLHQIALDALKSSPGSWDGAKDALFKTVRNDAELLWEMFARYRAQAAQQLLAQVMAEVRESERAQRVVTGPSASGQRTPDDHGGTARRANTQSSDGVGQRPVENQSIAARPVRNPREAMNAVAAVARLSLLDTFRINGRAIGDVTPGEALGWAKARRRDVRFVELLTVNLPPGDPIRKYRRAEDTQVIYEQAVQETRNAE